MKICANALDGQQIVRGWRAPWQRQGLAFVEIDGKWGAINAKGTVAQDGKTIGLTPST